MSEIRMIARWPMARTLKVGRQKRCNVGRVIDLRCTRKSDEAAALVIGQTAVMRLSRRYINSTPAKAIRLNLRSLKLMANQQLNQVTSQAQVADPTRFSGVGTRFSGIGQFLRDSVVAMQLLSSQSRPTNVIDFAAKAARQQVVSRDSAKALIIRQLRLHEAATNRVHKGRSGRFLVARKAPPIGPPGTWPKREKLS